MSTFWKGLVVVLVAPLMVTILGGLLVEVLKPRDPGFSATREQAKASVSENKVAAVSDVPAPAKETASNPLIGKWQTGTSVGERSLEFFPGGHVVREKDGDAWFQWPNGQTETLKYRYDHAKWELAIDGKSISLVSIDDGKLVISWDGRPVVYDKSGWLSFGASISIFTRCVIVSIYSIIVMAITLALLAAWAKSK